MKHAGISLTELFWNRSSSTESTSLLFLQKTFIPSASKLLVAVVILSMGSVLQTQAQTASASISTDAPGDKDKELYKPRAVHDKFSHTADAFRYLCLSVRRFVDQAKDHHG